MKKTLLAILSVAMMLSVISCGSTTEATEAKDTGVKTVAPSTVGGNGAEPKVSQRTTQEIKDYPGKVFNEPIPQWVREVAKGNYSAGAFIDIMPDMADKELFVISRRGQNRDFLQQWTNLVEIESEVASIFQRAIGKALQAAQSAVQNEGDTANGEKIEIDLKKEQETYQASMTNVILVGLKKTTDYWIQYEEIDKNDNVVDSYYDYFVVYTMPKDIYDQQIEAALNQVPEATDQDTRLKAIINETLTKQMLGGRSLADEEPLVE